MAIRFDEDFVLDHRGEIDLEKTRIYTLRKQFAQIDREEEIFEQAYINVRSRYRSDKNARQNTDSVRIK